MPAYVPPALRGVAGQQAEGQPKLGERVWRVKLEYSTGGPFDVSACPEPLLPIDEADQTSELVTVRHFELPSDASTAELQAVLTWLSKASAAASEQHPHGDARCQLVFPPSLSKETRKLLHASAETLQLPTFSKGLGDDRRLAVHGAGFRETPEMEAEVAAAAAARRKAPGPVRDRAKQIWRWCQADGGPLWSLSQGELEEALMAAPNEAALPGPVKDLLERRKHGTELIAAIRAGDNSAALAVLEAHPRSAWIRDDGGPPGGGGGGDPPGGCYPLHLAALAGLGEVVERIAAQPGTVEQRDRNYATPLKVAKKAGQSAMVDILLRHGAKDYEVTQAAHKTAVTGIPSVPPAGHGHTRRGSGGGSHGNSPAAGSPATGSSPAAGSGAAFMAAHAASRQRRSSIELHPHHPHPATPPNAASGWHSSQAGSHTHPHQTTLHQQQGGGGHHGHGPSGLGSGQRHVGGGQRRNGPEEHHPPAAAHGGGGAHGTAHDPTLNPFAILASGEAGSNSRRGSAGGASGLPPRPPSVGTCEAGTASGSDSDTGGGGGGGSNGGRGGNRGVGGNGGRVKHTGNWRPLPPIQSGDVSEATVLAALAQLGLSAEPGLPTAVVAEADGQDEGAVGSGNGGAAVSGGEEDAAGGAAGGDDAAPKKRKTRRGRRGRGSRRQSAASIDEAMTSGATAALAAAVAAGDVPGDGDRVNTPVQDPPPVGASGPQVQGAVVREHHHRSGSGAAGGHSGVSSEHSISEASDSEDGGGGSASGARTRRGGQPARSRRHERRRAARVSGADGSPSDRQPAGNAGNTPTERKTRRSSGTDYSSFHQGGPHGHGHAAHRGGAIGGHYQVFSGGHHYGHADDAASWRREPVAQSPAAAAAAAAGTAPLTLRDEPRPPAGTGGRAPAARRTSAGTGLPPLPAAGPVGGMGLPEAPSSPFHHGNTGAAMHGPREHVAAGPVAGFGFGRGRVQQPGHPPPAVVGPHPRQAPPHPPVPNLPKRPLLDPAVRSQVSVRWHCHSRSSRNQPQQAVDCRLAGVINRPLLQRKSGPVLIHEVEPVRVQV